MRLLAVCWLGEPPKQDIKGMSPVRTKIFPSSPLKREPTFPPNAGMENPNLWLSPAFLAALSQCLSGVLGMSKPT
jgi:hypothetical protein